jgi:hypothetical protein
MTTHPRREEINEICRTQGPEVAKAAADAAGIMWFASAAEEHRTSTLPPASIALLSGYDAPNYPVQQPPYSDPALQAEYDRGRAKRMAVDAYVTRRNADIREAFARCIACDAVGDLAEARPHFRTLAKLLGLEHMLRSEAEMWGALRMS